MDGVKSILMSKTIWGVIVSIVGKLAALAGYTITEGDEQELVALVGLLASAVGDAYAVYGRVKATKAIAR